MSKDKGGKKEVKKAPADKKDGKKKPISSYKNETGDGKYSVGDSAAPKSGGKNKS